MLWINVHADLSNGHRRRLEMLSSFTIRESGITYM